MILDRIVEDKKKRLLEHKQRIPENKMRRLAESYEGERHSFEEALGKDGISIIGEFKKASPSLGKIARANGPDAVLLIAAILDDAQLKDFYQLSAELGLDALVEVHDEAEMERALKLDARIIGVNNRNLKDCC